MQRVQMLSQYGMSGLVAWYQDLSADVLRALAGFGRLARPRLAAVAAFGLGAGLAASGALPEPKGAAPVRTIMAAVCPAIVLHPR